jgi:hypothetical protein
MDSYFFMEDSVFLSTYITGYLKYIFWLFFKGLSQYYVLFSGCDRLKELN